MTEEGPSPTNDHAVKTKPTWVPTEAGSHLRGRKAQNTKPEVALRKAVHGLGLRFRVHQTVAPRCTPDFVLPRWRLAVFVDGCFWHGCPVHGMKQYRGPNAELWRQKMETNRNRDRRNDAVLDEAGWAVLRVWECQVRRSVNDAATLVREAAQANKPTLMAASRSAAKRAPSSSARTATSRG
ncbi:very short patch repair endonuclease [Pseudofrankia sp. BMG5.37]|uniref:very short patch repair endonuclease n=1 Tax=Pseudofrankia sp. BMG5.37 TaxID=3050035 RepID=UPI002893E409|nr:very short patch repair endonuclease [Pseudofrankia sp. BMG5.37]MDT3444351.1 very short patch repair endonuclease [Pseudofrankia sp. BMG5.37]